MTSLWHRLYAYDGQWSQQLERCAYSSRKLQTIMHCLSNPQSHLSQWDHSQMVVDVKDHQVQCGASQEHA